MDSRAKTLKLFLVSFLGVGLLVTAVIGGSFIFLRVQNSSREPLKVRRDISTSDFETAHVKTVSTRIVILDGDSPNLVFSLEGHFKKSFGDPLIVSKDGRDVTVKIDEAQEGSHRAELTIFVPAHFDKKLEISTDSGRIDASVASAVVKHIKMSTVAGSTSLTAH